ncbi:MULTISPECIES: DUF3375 domain-containing protein [unclassified Janthinobacterium]|uniref:DUF3375 domain-containing protein n=1 Tax=unclassified Janthinobacterium TaxID=2610881 RepID=UPI00034DE8E6|nr:MULTISPECIES: DUF3375 domain-containing protein [unclassified Janthinobacterium]MEC5163455.1 hypothetical protein [Janthinobacterium sp. CG_S6]
MKADKTLATYRRMRAQPLWRLLASANGPTVMGLLQTHLYDAERNLPASIFHERIERELERLRNLGEDWPQTAQAYVAGWLAEGHLERRFPAGAAEEEYQLATSTIEALRFVSGLAKPHAAATESRLGLVIDALARLSDDTNADKASRIARLRAEQRRIEREIADIEHGVLRVLPEAAALERTREIITLADGLAGDFRRVRDQFEQLNRDLRERIMDNDGNRGDVLDSLFAGIDLIGESEAGRTFSAFWRLLTDPEQSATLEQALDQLMSRPFVAGLDAKERRFLLRLTRTLLEQGGMVHDVLQSFARSLKHFVQSREFLEQRRLSQLLRQAQRAALALKDEVKATETLHYTLALTSSSLRSLSQWLLHDPALQALPARMVDGDAAPIDLESVGELVAQSEIDFRTLKANVRAVLALRSQASVADVLLAFPAAQGLGSVLGLLALGSRHGELAANSETVAWTGADECRRSARIPVVYFLRERADELA